MKPMTPHSENLLDPHWVMFWRKVRAAADVLRRLEAEQAQGDQL